MSTVLSIAFTGLCALIADGNGAPGQILLLDASGVGEVQGVSLPHHAPTLVVSMNDLANPESSHPTRVIAGRPGPTSRVDQVGVWDLTGSEVRIRAQAEGGEGLKLYRPPAHETSWPELPRDARDPASWRDLRYVANMKSLVTDARIDPSLMERGALQRRGAVAARIHLDAGLLEGAMPSQESYRSDLFEFRGHGSGRALRQPLTDTVQWTLRTGADAVVIDIVPLAGGPPRRLLLGPSATPHRLFISNLPSENPSHANGHGVPDERMAAVHFGAYYKLLMHEPADQPLPELWHGSDGRKGTGFLRPAYCPPALFSEQ